MTTREKRALLVHTARLSPDPDLRTRGNKHAESDKGYLRKSEKENMKKRVREGRNSENEEERPN